MQPCIVTEPFLSSQHVICEIVRYTEAFESCCAGRQTAHRVSRLRTSSSQPQPAPLHAPRLMTYGIIADSVFVYQISIDMIDISCQDHRLDRNLSLFPTSRTR